MGSDGWCPKGSCLVWELGQGNPELGFMRDFLTKDPQSTPNQHEGLFQVCFGQKGFGFIVLGGCLTYFYFF